MSCDEVLRQLDEREVACRAEAERLEGEAERIAGLLSACQGELEKITIAREVFSGLPAARRSPEAAGAAGTGMFEEVLAVLRRCGRPMRCREVADELGLDGTAARHTERMRHRLKKLKKTGQVLEVSPGVFTLPGVRAAADG